MLFQVVHNGTSQQYVNTKKPSENDLDFAHPRKAHSTIPVTKGKTGSVGR